jgi:FkbM family methyltransferase
MLTLLQRFGEYRKLFGPAGIGLALRARASSRPIEVETRPIGFDHPLHLRLKTSDLPTLQKVWLYQEYAISLKNEPSFIIDAGANIGVASIYFATKFPKAKIVAIEPEPGNFALLEKNIRPYSNITAIRAALWNETGEVSLFDPGLGAWAFQTRTEGAKSIGRAPTVTIDELLRKFGTESVDILKMDIEGAEKEVFQNSSVWIGKVGVIMIELHDRFRPGCSRAFYLATGGFDQEQHRGETVILARKDLIASAP